MMRDLRNIKSVGEISAFLREQADLRAPENDEGGILQDLAEELEHRVRELESEQETFPATYALQQARKKEQK
jgi:hypothetical protein